MVNFKGVLKPDLNFGSVGDGQEESGRGCLDEEYTFSGVCGWGSVSRRNRIRNEYIRADLGVTDIADKTR